MFIGFYCFIIVNMLFSINCKHKFALSVLYISLFSFYSRNIRVLVVYFFLITISNFVNAAFVGSRPTAVIIFAYISLQFLILNRRISFFRVNFWWFLIPLNNVAKDDWLEIRMLKIGKNDLDNYLNYTLKCAINW